MAEGLPIEMILYSESEAETHEIGRRLGETLAAGALVLLIGDLGAGKTRLAAGIAAGLGVEGEVSSPTFVLERIHSGRPPLHHLDLYRVSSGDLDALDIEESLLSGHVVVVEWGEKIAAERRGRAIEIRIDFVTSDFVGNCEDSGERIMRIAGDVPPAFIGGATIESRFTDHESRP